MLLLFLSILLLSSTTFQNNVQAATAKSSAITQSSTASSPDGVRLIGLQLQLEQNGTNYYSTVNTTRGHALTNAQNNTLARFVLTFVNDNVSKAYMIQQFDVQIYNSTTTTIYENFLQYTFSTTAPESIIVPANGSYTTVFQGSLPFHIVKSNIYSTHYTIQYSLHYSLSTNVTDVHILNSPFNFTINATVPPYAPPTFIIYGWWAINAAIAIQLVIGWYGNRKVRKQAQTQNKM